MDLSDLLRKFKWKLELDNKGISFRKGLILVTLFLCFMLYFGPTVARWLFGSNKSYDPVGKCLDLRLDQYLLQSYEFDANVNYRPPREDYEALGMLQFVGNGQIGVEISPLSQLMIKGTRVLSFPIPFFPVVSVKLKDELEDDQRDANVIQFNSGIGYKIQCVPTPSGNVEVSHQIYAHRAFPSLLVQDIKITNPTERDVTVVPDRIGTTKWSTSTFYSTTMKHGDGEEEYQVISGSLETKKGPTKNIMEVVIATRAIPKTITVKAKSSETFHVFTVVAYSPVGNNRNSKKIKDSLQTQVINDLTGFMRMTSRDLKTSHVQIWNQLFSSGLSISTSKASGALNGDRINATIYLTLSQVRAPLYERNLSPERREELNSLLSYSEGCYGTYQTLQATNLWSDISTTDNMVRVTSLWLKTLETHGCHNLIKTGADGVMQAMLLSFGGFKFKNQHLEFNTEPKDLHRDFHYRRINYGNGTHVNVSVAVMEDNKAAIYVALDRSDKNYYACDGGCLDPPVQLGPQKVQFPVKLTQPTTAVLYITYDKEHMEDLKHTIHVKEVAEAPAHEHHVIALHKHGHQLGGLPAFFWATFSLLIILFHLFLFKLIYNEYCGNAQLEFKPRGRKLSDL